MGLCAGTLIDIVTAGRRKVAHSWHLDSGLEMYTVMLGFPAENRYEGPGVFSHAAKLSHHMADQVPGGGQVRGLSCCSIIVYEANCLALGGGRRRWMHC